eukprot:365743-Chlamydomonas_euryale.AAC.29
MPCCPDALQPQYPFLGDVRGLGLMLGIEVVSPNSVSMAPAPVLAGWVVSSMRSRRVLLSTDGPYDNVIK